MVISRAFLYYSHEKSKNVCYWNIEGKEERYIEKEIEIGVAVRTPYILVSFY